MVIATCIDQALETSAYVSEELGLPCHISYKDSLNLTNKKFMKKKMLENQIPTSNYYILKEKKEIRGIEKLVYPLVIKPVDANSSKGVFKVTEAEEICHYFELSKSYSKTGEVIIEEFVEGKELSVDAFVIDNEPSILMITENVKSQDNKKSFTITESVYNYFLENKLKSEIKLITKKISGSFGIANGPLLIQCIYDENTDQIKVIEFSSRIGGGSKYYYIQTITGFDVLNAFVKITLSEEVEITKEHKYNYAKIRYLYTNPGTIAVYKGFDKLKSEGIIQDYFYYKTIGSKVTESTKSTDRCAGIFITSQSKKELNDNDIFSLCQLNVLDQQSNNILII